MSSSTRKLSRNPKRKAFAFKTSSKTPKYGAAYKLGRNSRVWKAMHPGQDGWKLTPPIPGTQVGQDLYIAKLHAPGKSYPSDYPNGYGLFVSKKAARAARPYTALVRYDDAETIHYVEKKYGDVYKFHRLTSVRSRGRSRFGS